MLHRIATLVFFLSLIVTPSANGQQGVTTYVYDEDGRLIAVISATGEAGVYAYDAGGNFTSITRLTPNDLSILAFSPDHGPVGTSVTIYGTGFNQGVSAVSFNGVPANIVSSSLATVVAIVPESATTGPITVVTPRGNVTSTKPFVVRGVRVSPDVITIAGLETVQFDLSISGTPTSNVVWGVNGVVGGNQTVGTISSNGFYVAPNLVGGNTAQFTVRATSVDDAELFDEAIVNVVPVGEGFQFRADGVSVQYGIPPNRPPAFVNNGVSVRYGSPVNRPPTFVNAAVSVRYGTPVNSPLTVIRDQVSVSYGTPTNGPPAFINGAVSATHGPTLSSLTPASIARGTGGVTLTIAGAALNGAIRISFFNRANGNPASGITVSNITVNGAGTSVTATLTVTSNAAVGSYIVVVTTSSDSTVRSDVGSNILQIN